MNRLVLMFCALALCVLSARASAPPAQGPHWNGTNTISADLKDVPLRNVLERIAVFAGWKVYVEPGLNPPVSAKFKELQIGEALRLLLPKLNYAMVPSTTNGSTRLFVFRTSRDNATQLIQPADAETARNGLSNRVPRELVVTLKKGAKIDELARLLGAKVVGKLDGQNAYRLQFDDEKSTELARGQLEASSDVESVENNYYVDRPPTPQLASGANVPPVNLQLRPPPSDGRVVVGLVDTAVQPLGGNLDAFLMKQISIAGEADLNGAEPLHGTSMAENVLRSLQAITKGSTSVQILPVDVYGRNAATTSFDVAAGIVAAVNGGATVVNLSLGSPSESEFLRKLMQELQQKNIRVIAAAGNEPVTTSFYPAAYPGVLAVTAVDRGQLASYANRGSFVSLGAPGNSVVYYRDQTFSVVGTSAASAFASGIAAGYMETTGANYPQTESFLRQNFGVTITPAGPAIAAPAIAPSGPTRR
jgi:hypothetical protein